MAEPSQAARLRQEIQRWFAPPGGDRSGRIAGRQITRLLSALDSSEPNDELHLSAIAEAQFARHMLAAGCVLEFEARTPSGRHADFRVARDGTAFYVHIKRLWVGVHARARAVPEAFAPIEAVPRPLVVGIRWHATAGAEGIARLVHAARELAEQASVGDEIAVRSDAGAWIGNCRILAPHAGDHVALRADYDTEEDAAVPRAQRLLRRAFGQFMPGAPNVVCVVGDGAASANALETALLGSMIERWDRFPPRGRRVAHGRAHDGFWSRGQYDGCELVAWLPIDDRQSAHVWRREGATLDPRVEAIVREALAAPQSSEGASSPTA